ncbi:MAG: FtsW/RodA/SpoVE family cell cycle protein [Clostridiales bacterium]|nr:FtsW/RodA/SpoVE family cell cycle protein [Clostridiales bacterium]
MLNIISTGSNYIIIIMCVIYALSSFTVFLPSSEKRQIKRMNRQERYMFLFHFICYGVLFLKTFDVKILILYVVEVFFFLLLIFIYEHLYPDSSRVLMNHTCFLLQIGFVMLTRLSFDQAVKQFLIAVVSSTVVLVVPFIVAKAYWLKRLRWVYGLIGLAFLSTVFVIGTTKNGSTNWISFGGFALQPSEFVKIAFVFFIAAMLEKPASFRKILVTILFSAAHVLILILEKDLGGALLYFVIFIFMCYVATGRFIYMLGGVSLGALAGRVAYGLFSHVRVRFDAWLDPWSDIENTGYQITQSLFAIGTGSWFGMGLTQGRPSDIPVVESDFIFSAIAEEFGVFFALCLILIYLGIFVHFLKIAMDVKGRFYKLVAYGFSICFIFQVFLNIGGVTKFIPSTGVTLPLISYGGSSVASTLIIFAIMQGIFIIAYQEEEEGGDGGQTTEIEKTGGAVDGDWEQTDA